jgi:hypothetical protein
MREEIGEGEGFCRQGYEQMQGGERDGQVERIENVGVTGGRLRME